MHIKKIFCIYLQKATANYRKTQKMVIDNKEFEASVRLYRMISLFVTALTISFIIYIKEIDNYSFGLTRMFWALLIFLAYAIYNILRIRRNYHYIYFSDEENKITVRFYSTNMFTKKFKAIEIPYTDFYKYELEGKGIDQTLKLFFNKDNKIYKFDPIPLSALNKRQVEQITNSLNQIRNVY